MVWMLARIDNLGRNVVIVHKRKVIVEMLPFRKEFRLFLRNESRYMGG